MNARCSVCATFILFLLFIQPLISGCVMTSSKNLYKKDGALDSQQLFQDKCSKCHELPDINAYPYTPDDWANIVDNMIETEEAGQYISLEEAEEIKNYLRIFKLQ